MEYDLVLVYLPKRKFLQYYATLSYKRCPLNKSSKSRPGTRRPFSASIPRHSRICMTFRHQQALLATSLAGPSWIWGKHPLLFRFDLSREDINSLFWGVQNSLHNWHCVPHHRVYITGVTDDQFHVFQKSFQIGVFYILRYHDSIKTASELTADESRP